MLLCSAACLAHPALPHPTSGSDDFSNSGYNFPSSGLMPVVPSAAGAFAEPQLQLQQAADRPSAWGWEDESFVPLKLPPAALGLLSQVGGLPGLATE